MVFGERKDQEVGKAVIMNMKLQSTTLAPCKLKNALLLILMLEGINLWPKKLCNIVLDMYTDTCKKVQALHILHSFYCWSRVSSDGRRTLFVDLGSDDLKPEGWDKLADKKPPVNSFSDISIYELHIRDFR